MTKTIFGTDGIRATVGTPPMTSEQLPMLADAIAQWLCTTYPDNPTIIMGHDTRISCSFIKAALSSKLLLYPITIYDAYVIPTPALYLLTRLNKYMHGGIIITASHNPFQDNGIKLVTMNGKLSEQDELKISALFQANTMRTPSYDTLGTMQPFPHAAQQYLDHLAGWFENRDFIQGKTIVLDCAHGATSTIAPALFKRLGAHVITLHNAPNGFNINEQCGALHPHALQKAVVHHNADAGFAFDGDGDRIIAVNRHGEIKDGDAILALLLGHPVYAHTQKVVGTIMTNCGFEQWLMTQGKTLIRTPVGDKHVAYQLAQENLLLGGEQSGHIIVRDYLDVGDGIFTALRILEAMHATNNTDMITFEKYPQVTINVAVSVKKDLAAEPLATLIEQSKKQLHAGRLVVRYSGTENLVRVMVEDASAEHANSIAQTLAHTLQKTLSMP